MPRPNGIRPSASGRTQIVADVPELELTRYAVELRSLSHGTATFTRAYSAHEPMPSQLAKKIAEESGEVIIAARDHDIAQTRYEAGDLLYHLLVVLVREGVPIEDLAIELSGRVGLPPRQ